MCTKYTKCYYFHSAYAMKTVSNSHFQFLLEPCGGLKINVKTGKSIWLRLNCGYCHYHKFFLLKIILERLKNLLNILPNNILNLNTVMSSTERIARADWILFQSLLSHLMEMIILLIFSGSMMS